MATRLSRVIAGLRSAVAQFLTHEREAVMLEAEALGEFSPFKRGG